MKGGHLVNFLNHYKHNGIILNTKEQGMEMCLIQMMNQFDIADYFFLDLSLPFFVKTVKNGCHKVSVRFSEYEPLEFVSKFQDLAEWVWVDCFSSNMLTPSVYDYLHHHFKTCIVSPELQGHPLEWIQDFKKAYEGFELDAVCTKKPDLWK